MAARAQMAHRGACAQMRSHAPVRRRPVAARVRTRRRWRRSCRRRRRAPGAEGWRELRRSPLTLPRRAAASSPRWGRTSRARQTSCATGRPHQRASSVAISAGGSAPRSNRRSRTAGTTAIASTAGRGSSWAISAAARRPGEISPRFQRPTSASAGPSSQSAERAVVNQRSRLHARHAATVSAVGAPHRPHSGAASARRAAPQSSHIHSPGVRQAAQRRGNTRRTREPSGCISPG